MALGAFSGFEYVAILAGECQSPGAHASVARSRSRCRSSRSCSSSAPSSTLALVPGDQIDLVSPIPQTLTIGFQGMGIASLIVPALILMLAPPADRRGHAHLRRQHAPADGRRVGRAPPRLVHAPAPALPHADATPSSSSARSRSRSRLAGQIGVGVQEAFQLLENAAGILYAFTYLALFAIPIFAARRLTPRPPLWLRLASAAGFAVSALYSVLSVFPIIDVPSWPIFSLKIISVLVVAQLVGVGLYLVGRRRAVTRD